MPNRVDPVVIADALFVSSQQLIHTSFPTLMYVALKTSTACDTIADDPPSVKNDGDHVPCS